MTTQPTGDGNAAFSFDLDTLSALLIDSRTAMLERETLGELTGHWEPRTLTATQHLRIGIATLVNGAVRDAVRMIADVSEWSYYGGITQPLLRLGARVVHAISPAYADTHYWVEHTTAQQRRAAGFNP